MKHALRACVFLVVFVIVGMPIAMMFGAPLIEDGGLSLKAYSSALLDARQLGLLRNSLEVSCGATLVAGVFGVLGAVVLARVRLPLRRMLIALFVVPVLIPPYVHGVAWIVLLGRQGWVHEWLGRAQPLFTIYGTGGTAFVLGMAYMPFVLFMTLKALAAVSDDHESAARLHSSPLQALLHVSLHMSLPDVMFGALLVFLFAFGDFSVPSLLRVNVYSIEIFTALSAHYDLDLAAGLAAVPMALAVGLAACYVGAFGGESYASIGGDWRPAALWRGRLAKWVGLSVCMGILALCVAAPVAALAHKAQTLTAFGTAIRTAVRQILSTVATSAAAGLLVVLLGASLHGSVPVRLRRWLLCGAWVPFAVPPAIFGIGLIRTWNRSGPFQHVYGTAAILILAYVARFLPFGVVATHHSLLRIDRDLTDAADLAGAGPLKRVLTIILPLTWRSWLTAWGFTFALSVGEIGASILVNPPGFSTLPIRIHSLLHYGEDEIVAALCLLLVAIALVPFALSWAVSCACGRCRGGYPAAH